MISIKQAFNLEGRTALITGGSRGLGLQMAEALGEMGARVVLSARKQHELEEAKAHLEANGIRTDIVAGDCQNEADIQNLATQSLKLLGEVDILVNNAGTTWGSATEDHPVDAWDKVMNLNVRSIFLLSKEIGRRSMIPRKQGRIINVASIAGLKGNPPGGQPTLAYNTSKAAVINLTRALASEWGKYNINVNALAPGMFPSKMTRGTIERVGAESILTMTPLRRMGDDGDLKGAAVLFASAAGKHITGQTIAIDGGRSIV
jgi:NAD(P)-dependent dehydrogenase (short-subunit alcohol dehydrogenase family)